MKKIVTLTAVVLAVTAASTYAEDIGVVNMKKIFSASPKVKQIKSDLTKQFASQKNDLKKMGASLQSDMQKYQKNKAVMSKKDLAKMQAKISAEEMKFRQEQGKFQQAVYAAQNSALKTFMDNVKAVVKKVAAKKDVDVVLPKNVVLYSKSEMDLTQAVIDHMK